MSAVDELRAQMLAEEAKLTRKGPDASEAMIVSGAGLLVAGALWKSNQTWAIGTMLAGGVYLLWRYNQ
jgi:hypothetical protein